MHALFTLFQEKTERRTPGPEERRGSSGGVVVPRSNWSSRYDKDETCVKSTSNYTLYSFFSGAPGDRLI